MRFELRRVALVAVLSAVVILPWVKVAAILHSPPRSVPVTERAEGVVWANRVFVNRHALAVWLRSRGAQYDAWARNHPALAAGTVPGAEPKPAKGAQGRHVASPAQAQPAASGTSLWLGRLGWLALALVLTAGLVVAIARSVQRVDEEPPEYGPTPIANEPREAVQSQRVRVRSSAS